MASHCPDPGLTVDSLIDQAVNRTHAYVWTLVEAVSTGELDSEEALWVLAHATCSLEDELRSMLESDGTVMVGWMYTPSNTPTTLPAEWCSSSRASGGQSIGSSSSTRSSFEEDASPPQSLQISSADDVARFLAAGEYCIAQFRSASKVVFESTFKTQFQRWRDGACQRQQQQQQQQQQHGTPSAHKAVGEVSSR